MQSPFEVFDSVLRFAQESPQGTRTRHGWGEDSLGTWAVVQRGDDSLIGHVSLGPAARTYWTLSREDPDSLYVPWEVDLVCVLDEPAWDQGYDVEACKAMLAHAFEDMRLARIVNHLDQDDLRAISLAEGLGFRVEPNQHPHYRGLVATLANTSL